MKVHQIKSGHEVLTSLKDIAKAFDDHFTNIGQTIACIIPTVDIHPLFLCETL